MAKTIEEILEMSGLAFAPNMEPHYMTELESIWNDAVAESGGDVTDAQVDEYLDVLKNMGLVIPVHKEKIEKERSKKHASPDPEVLKMRRIIRDEREAEEKARREERAKNAAADKETAAPDPDMVYRIFPGQSRTDLGHKIILILDVPAGKRVPHHVRGAFTNPDRFLGFEYFLDPARGDNGSRAAYTRSKKQTQTLAMSGADIRFRKLFTWLGEKHISVRLSGSQDRDQYYVYRIKAVEPPDGSSSLQVIEDTFLQYMIERLRTSIIQAPGEEIPEQMSINTLPDMVNFMACCSDTLPANIRAWANKNIVLAGADTGNPDEKRHAQRALSMMLTIRWKSSYFDPIDPDEARRILDEELYGLEKVKQRVIETIIQINRTHTLPSYGLLLAGPAGTGKSQIAYAVARILKIPSAVFDMSTVRDPEALTGTPRIYTNARPGRIMEAFTATGSSNVVFVINELDKADSEGQNGNPADTLLTLLDNLGFTDNYMECQIPTGGVYPIATANDKDRISEPLISRFAVIDIPDYTSDEKKIIFRDYSLPKVLRRMGMDPKECRVTDDAVDAIIELYRERPGCRDLEQAAEHLAGNALYEIETTNAKEVTFDAAKAVNLLRG